jgi:hypothetical protein
VLLVVALLVAPPAQADRAALERYADATWASFVAMTEEESGLPTDLLHADGSRRGADVGRTASRAAPATTPPTAERAKKSFAAGTARTCCRPARATMSSPGARAPTTPRAARGRDTCVSDAADDPPGGC